MCRTSIIDKSQGIDGARFFGLLNNPRTDLNPDTIGDLGTSRGFCGVIKLAPMLDWAMDMTESIDVREASESYR